MERSRFQWALLLIRSSPSPVFSVYEERMHSWVAMPPGIEHMA